jgi:Cu-Zn family superoxide dismutase
MTRSIRHTTLALLVLALWFTGCRHNQNNSDQGEQTMTSNRGNQPKATALIRPAGAAATMPSMGQVTGTATFTQTGPQTVQMVVDLKGLAPNSKHGIHIHERGDLTAPDLSSAGAHYDPAMTKQHGGPDSAHHHAGDAGNIEANAQGDAHLEVTLNGVSLTGNNSIVGRSVIVHGKADDLHSNPAGNSGPRIAGGVIERANEQ